MTASAELACARCRYTCLCGPPQMLEWLRGVNMVRRETAPEPELLPELFRVASGRFACPKCQTVGLQVREVEPEDDEDWGMARKCAACGKPIARERLEALPDTQLCVGCQGRDDRGEAAGGAAEYCPRCGNVMTLVQSRRGVTRYVMRCPSCRQEA